MEKLASFDPDIVILDVMMPKMDGLEFLRHLRADPEHSTVPVLVQTALSSPSDRDNVYKAGATDMLNKPISAGELLVRMRTHLENRLLFKSLQDRMRLEAEVNAARQMQEALLPQQALLDDIRKNHDLCIRTHFETSSELGGDLWELGKAAGILSKCSSLIFVTTGWALRSTPSTCMH